MKPHLLSILTLVLAAFYAHGQGTFIYDQQSSLDETPWGYGGGPVLQQAAPCGETFAPTLSAVGFIRLNLSDNDPNNGLGATIYLNLRTNWITGAILGSTAPVALPNGFTGVANFLFPSAVSVTPGAQYVWEVVVQPSGDLWRTAFLADTAEWPGGTAIANGMPSYGDFWFREGVVVPEPSSTALILVGVGCFALHLRRKFRSR